MVGYAERCEVAGRDDDDEQSFWREYLLYHRSEGFAFLVDAEDGWSWSAPITGVPERAGDGVKYQGVLYRKLYDYAGKATYVLGEFYWKLERDAKTFNTDYMGTGAFGTRRLNREQTGQGADQEVVWSAGETLSADAVLKAFKLAPDKSASLAARCTADLRQRLVAAGQGVLLGVRGGDPADAVPLRRQPRLQPGARHLRRSVGRVPELPAQREQWRAQRRRLVRRLVQRRRPQVNASH